MLRELTALFSENGIPAFGVAAFRSDLLLAGVRSAARLPKAAKSVIVCAFPYYVGEPEGRNLALYAMLPDYHAVVLGMLEAACAGLRALRPGGTFVPFSDASPIDEVEAAVRAGLGARGQNGLLLGDGHGSLCFLGEIVTDVALPAIDQSRRCCGCGACVRACPTGALSAEGFDRERCLSYLTQKKGALTAEQERLIRAGGLAWGCDRCLLACPKNRGVAPTPIAAFRGDVEPVLTAENLDRLLRNRAFAWRGRAVLERNLALLSRNESECNERDGSRAL